MKYLLETYGCQMNKAESAAMENILRDRGWEPSAADAADLVLINTCTVRATAENRAWGRIAQYAADKRRRSFSLVVVGCMAEQHGQAMKRRVPEIDYVLGTFQKQSFGLVLDQIESGTTFEVLDEKPAYVFSKTHHEPGSFRAFVPIMHGCNNFCTYCIVPYVRGRETSRSPDDIIAEIDALEVAGVREVTLLGQNVNSYRWSAGEETIDFPALLRIIARHLEKGGRFGTDTAHGGIGWIRFLTSHPKDLSDGLIQVLADEPLLCKHVHLCLQSGSDSVLRAMNRKYGKEYYLNLAERLREAVPDLSLSTDILVGFPGEEEEDVEETLDVMRKVRFSYSFMYHFNPRAGTPAVSLPGKVPEKTKRERLARVIELQKRITSESMRQRVGNVDTVLFEDRSKRSSSELLGRTARDEMVVAKADPSLIGNFAAVRLTGISGNTFKAELVDA